MEDMDVVEDGRKGERRLMLASYRYKTCKCFYWKGQLRVLQRENVVNLMDEHA